MLDIVGLTDQIEALFVECHAVPVPRLLCELDSIVGENGVDLVGYCLKQVLQELPSCFSIGFLYELGHHELAGSVNGDKEIELSLLGSGLGNIDVEIADWISLELLTFGFVPVHVRKPRDTMPLQTPMQRRARQMWDRRLQSIEAVVQRQQCVPPEGDDHCLLVVAQNSGAWLLRAGLLVFDRLAFAPLRNGLWVDPKFPAQLRDRSLRLSSIAMQPPAGQGVTVSLL